MTFGEYVSHYKLKRSEGVVLRYLSDVYKGLIQNVADEYRTDEIDDLTAWLGALVRQVDSSLIDEWERLIAPDPDIDAAAPVRPTATTVVDDERAFRVMVRNQVFEWAQRLARRTGYDALLVDPVDPERFASIEDVVAAMDPVLGTIRCHRPRTRGTQPGPVRVRAAHRSGRTGVARPRRRRTSGGSRRSSTSRRRSHRAEPCCASSTSSTTQAPDAGWQRTPHTDDFVSIGGSQCRRYSRSGRLGVRWTSGGGVTGRVV